MLEPVDEQLLRLADGRTLRVADSGHDAPVALFHHGTPGGVYNGQALAARAAGRIRVISYDRPGYGQSTPRPGRSVADVGEDVTAIADALDLGRFATWGWSGGGPHAIATAALLGDRVTACAVWASPLPGDADADFLAGMAEANVHEFELAMAGRAPLEAEIRPAAEEMKTVTVDEAVQALEPYCSAGDMASLRRTTEAVIEPMLEAMSADGWIDDDLAFVRAWGVPLDVISSPVAIWHGPEDLMVPLAHGRWLAAHIAGAALRGRPDDGHITLVETALTETVDFLTSA
jgi:pimeloyl-ACP methyl ester carboxylesterase